MLVRNDLNDVLSAWQMSNIRMRFCKVARCNHFLGMHRSTHDIKNDQVCLIVHKTTHFDRTLSIGWIWENHNFVIQFDLVLTKSESNGEIIAIVMFKISVKYFNIASSYKSNTKLTSSFTFNLT